MTPTLLNHLRIGLTCVAVCCSALLLREYFLFQQHNRQLLALQEQYRLAIDALRQGQLAEKTATPQTENGGMTLVNRTPTHLQAAALSYLEKKNLIDRLDHSAWLPYADHLLQAPVITSKARVAPPQKLQKKAASQKKNIPTVQAINQKGAFIWPIEPSKFWLSSFFGPRKSRNGNRFHRGIDMASPRNTPIKAAATGRVIEARQTAGYGNTIVISHADRYKTRYAHMERMLVKSGQHVKQGETIGTVGDTGFTIRSGKEGTHLHFELHSWGKLVNPLRVLPTRRS